MTHRPLLLCLLLLTAGQLAGQQLLIRGVVTDAAGAAVRAANVALRAATNEPILAFAITAADGAFQLTWPPGSDSLWLHISHLNYEEAIRRVRPADRELSIQLSDRVYELPTPVVRQEAVVRRGDTLIFDVNQLRELGDETVEQVLQRIPGVEIAVDGTIRYQGLDISRFYIEGLDLLEGRYALATRNLRADVIRDIEILEHHQAIRALDSLVRPPNAAINLRLKSKIALTGQVRAGTGAAPLLHQLEATLFGFKKTQQFSVLGSANNVGNATGDNFKDLYRTQRYRLPLVQATVALPPVDAAPAYYLDNQERSGGFNWLRKLGDYTQLKWNGFATHDRIMAQGRNELTYRDAEQSLTINEQLSSLSRPLTLNNRLLYEVNKDRLFVSSSLEGQHTLRQTEVANRFNAVAAQEDYEQATTDLRGRLTGIVRRGNKAYRLNGSVDYSDQQYDLRLGPLTVLTPDLPLFTLDTARQTARVRRLTADLHTNLFARRQQWRSETRLGTQLLREQITSELSNGNEQPLGADFLNDNRQTVFLPYLHQQLEHDRPRRLWRLELPLSTHFFTFREAVTENRTLRALLVLRPELSLTLRLKHQRTWSFAYAYDLDYNQDDPIFAGYVLVQNRQFDRRLPNLNRTREHHISSRLLGQNQRGTLTYNTHLQGSLTRSDFLNTTVFDTTGEASAQLAVRNVRRRISLQNRFGFKMVPNTTAQLEANYALVWLPLVLNQERVTVALHQFTLAPDVTYTFASSALRLRPRLAYFANALAGQAALRYSLQWSYFHQFSDQWGSLKLSFDQYYTTSGQRRVGNHLLNMRYQRPILGGKFELSLLLNNLTNASDFVTFTQQVYAEDLSRFQLRRRQVLIVLGKKI